MSETQITLHNEDGSSTTLAINDTYVPAPPVVQLPIVVTAPRMRIGNVGSAGNSSAAISATDALQGAGSVMRYFNTSGLALPPAVATANKRDLIGSYKSGNANPSIALAYWLVTKDHEVDHQIIQKATTLVGWKADMATDHKAGIKNQCAILTGDAWVNPDKNPDDYLLDFVEIYGCDLDGVSNGVPYPDKRKIIDKATAWAQKNGKTMFGGEVSTDRDLVKDPSGYLRAQWMLDTFSYMQEAGWIAGCWWEDSIRQVNSALKGDAELWTMKSLMAQSFGPRPTI